MCLCVCVCTRDIRTIHMTMMTMMMYVGCTHACIFDLYLNIEDIARAGAGFTWLLFCWPAKAKMFLSAFVVHTMLSSYL